MASSVVGLGSPLRTPRGEVRACLHQPHPEYASPEVRRECLSPNSSCPPVSVLEKSGVAPRVGGRGRRNECSPPPHCRPLCLRQARDIGCWIPALTLDETGLKIPKNNRTPTELLGKHRLRPRRHPRMGKNNLQSLFEADVLVKYFVVSKVLRKGAWKDPAKYRMTQKSTSRSSRKSQLGNET